MSANVGILRGALAAKAPTGAASGAGAMLTLTDAARRVARWTPDRESPFARIGKTGWQITLADPALTLRAMLYVQARLLATPDRLTSRIVIASHPADQLDGNGQSAAAERAMAGLTKLTFATFAGPELLPQAILSLADHIARNWTPEQAEAIALALPPDNPTLAVLATRLGISKQAVSYRLTGAGLRNIRTALAAWEAAMTATGLAGDDVQIGAVQTGAVQIG